MKLASASASILLGLRSELGAGSHSGQASQKGMRVTISRRSPFWQWLSLSPPPPYRYRYPAQTITPMNEPSSRTPEGIPHRCGVCGTSFQLNTSLTGDACCPNCNALVWPVGEDGGAPQSVTSQVSRSRIKEIRLRPSGMPPFPVPSVMKDWVGKEG